MQDANATTRPRSSLVGTGGCLTCRIRKVKCDEAKPACRKCRSTGRACDGYSVLPFARTELLQASRRQGHGSELAIGGRSLAHTMLIDGAFRGKLERRYFQFFRCCTVACTNLTVRKSRAVLLDFFFYHVLLGSGYFDFSSALVPLTLSQVDSPFWNRIILQAFHAEPAVKHAVLALAAMHSGMLDRQDEHASRQHMLYAKEQYTVALGEARQLVANAAPTQMHRVLIVCLLFVAWEGVRGDYLASQRHMDSGRALAARFHHQIRQKASLAGIVHEIMLVLARMDISAISFSDDSAPYRALGQESVEFDRGLAMDAFASIQDANASLMNITRCLLRLGSEIIPGIAEAEAAQRQSVIDKYSRHLREWAVHWERWCAANKISSDSLSILNVQLWFTCAKTLLKTGFRGPETRYDNATGMFRDVVGFSEKLSAAIFQESGAVSLSLDLGYMIPTFFVATRCRDPSIRRRALHVLQSYPRHEGAWQSGPAAVIAERWIAVEESGPVDVHEAAQILEGQRVVLMEVQVQKSDALARLRFQLAGAEGACSVVEEIASW